MKTNYHKAGFLVTLLSTFGMKALAEDDGSLAQMALALGMSKEVVCTFAKPFLGMASDQMLKLSEDARSAIGHELNSHLEGAIKEAYKNALSDIEKELVQELALKESRTELWRRLLLNEAGSKRETYEELVLGFFIPLREVLSKEDAIIAMLAEHEQLQPDEYISHIIREKLPAYAGADRELFVADIAARFRKHYPHHFLQQLKKDDKAKTVYFTITLEALLRSGIEQKELLQAVLAELKGDIPNGLPGIRGLIEERTQRIEEALDALRQQIAARAEPDLINTDRYEKRNRSGNEGNLFNYKYRYTAFTGRNREMSELLSFLEHEECYSWWMITGPGGMGKSRLALEMVKVALQKGWNAGVLDIRDDFDWAHWNPGRDTLIVIDYAFANTEATASLMGKIGARAERYRKKVRILLLERNITTEWKTVLTKPAIRDYTYRHPDTNEWELKAPDSLWLIITDVIIQSALEPDEKYGLLCKETEIQQDLEQIDPQRRPLFAFFAAKALVYSEGKNIRGWNADRLLEFHLDRLEAEYWSKSEIYRSNELAFKKLLLITTLCRQVPVELMPDLERELHLPPQSKSVFALLTDDDANRNNERGYYTGLQPDMLAGYFIIRTFNALVDGSIAGTGEDDADTLLQGAWEINSFGSMLSIYLLWQDFIAGQGFVCDYDIMQFLESYAATNSAEEQIIPVVMLVAGIGEIWNERKEYSSALAFYDRAIRLQPDFVEVYYNRGVLEACYGDVARALSDFSEVIRLQPDNATAYYNRGGIRNGLGEKAGALSDYTEAIRLQPDYAQAYNNRGSIKYDMGDLTAAQSDFSESIRLQSDYATAYYNRAILRDEIGDKEAALKDYTEAIRLQSDYIQAYNNRGVLRKSIGEYKGALADFSESIRLQPNDAKAYKNRGSIKDDIGESEGALADYTAAIRLQPDDAEVYCNRGVLRGRFGDIGGALADYTEAIRLQPDDANAYNNRGVLKDKLGDKDGALADYNDAIRLQPDDADAYHKRGVIKNSIGDKPGALRDYDEAIRLEPDDAGMYNSRAELRESIGDREGALLDYEEVMRLCF